jgi:5-methylcytosine-specific restriction enzyme A
MQPLSLSSMAERLAWYSQKRWRSKSKAQLRDHPLCAKCLNRGTITAATIADHVIPHRGDAKLFWFGELQSLCAHCHNRFKQIEELHGYSTDIDRDGWPIDPRHPANGFKSK